MTPEHGMQPRAASQSDFDAIAVRLGYLYEGVFNQETVDLAVGEARAELESVSRIPTYLPPLTEKLAKERLLAAAQADGLIAKSVPEILFVCVHNAGRSQLAAALARHLSHGKVHVRSAGSAPTREVLPLAIEVLAEIGVQVDHAFPKPLSGDVVRAADVIVTMGCGDACPVLPGRRYEDWQVSDPDGQPLEVVRAIRDDIAQRVTSLLAELIPEQQP